MAKQPGSDWGSVSSFGGKVSSVFKGAGSGGARVRKNTNAVSGVAKPNAKPDVKTGGGLSSKKSVIKPGAGSAKETNYIQKNSVKVKQKDFEVEIQGKMYKTGGPAERKMEELRKVQSGKGYRWT
jgi:hypothetical protein